MEAKLKELIEGNSDENRTKWAMEWKNQGKKVVGIISSDVPEEVIHAADMLPWRITGTWGKDVSLAIAHRGECTCSYCTNVLESVLKGQTDFLDGIVATDVDQDIIRTFDVIVSQKKPPFCHLMHMPISDSEHNIGYFSTEVRKLIDKLEALGNTKITDEAIRASIEIYNKTRALLGRMYELRKREIPPITGAEALGITTTAQIMPKEVFNRELEALLPYLETRKTTLKNTTPRVLVSSEMLDNPAYLDLVEENGVIVMDDMDTGSRYFTGDVDTSLSDPAQALSARYMTRPASPRMVSWDRQVEQISKWVREYNVQGVISLPIAWCYPQRFRVPYLRDKLQEAGIPSASFDRDYDLSNVGQLRTRIGAFMEMLEGIG